MITVEMFKDYKEEDMRFLNLYGKEAVYDRSLASQIENDVNALSDDDKDKIIHMIIAEFEYYKTLIKEFIEDKENGVVKGRQGYMLWKAHHASIKAWRKRHDLDIPYFEGDLMYILPSRRWSTFDTSLRLDADEEKINKFITNYICENIFKKTKSEFEYFEDHDEYSTLADKLKQRYTYQNFDDYSFFERHGVVYRRHNESGKTTEMSLEELKAVNAFFDKLDNDVNLLISKSFSEFPIDK